MNKKKNYKKLLNTIFKDYEECSNLYKATIFWKSANQKIKNYLSKNKINNFKRNAFCKNFFIPSYNFKNQNLINSSIKPKDKHQKKFLFYLRNLINGYNQAFSDYKVYKASDDIKQLPYLHNFSETKFGNPVEQFIFDKKRYSRSSLNYILGLVFFKKYVKNFIPKTILEIGGGFGSLGEVYAFSGVKNFKYINVDLPSQAFITELYLSKLFHVSKVSSYLKIRNLKNININKLKTFSSLVTWQIEKLSGKLDLFINFISFQEMEPKVVKNYLSLIIKLKPKYILLRNLREGKQVSKNALLGVQKKITKSSYVNFLKGKYFLLKTNVVPFGYKTYDNYNSELLLFKKL